MDFILGCFLGAVGAFLLAKKTRVKSSLCSSDCSCCVSGTCCSCCECQKV